MSGVKECIVANTPLNSELLIAFLLGDLDPAETARVQALVDANADTSRELARLQRIVHTLTTDDGRDPSPGLVNAVKAMATRAGASWFAGLRQVLATLVFDSTAQTAVAGFRGVSNATHFTYVAGDVEIDVRVSPPAPGSGRYGLMGQVEAPGAALSRAALLDDDGLAVALGDVDDRGRFKLDAPKGVYDLCVATGDSAIKLPRFRVE